MPPPPPPSVKVELNVVEEKDPPPPTVNVDRKRKVKEEPTLPSSAKVERNQKVKEEEQPPPPSQVERNVKEEEPLPPTPEKVERKVKEEESMPTSKVNAGGDGAHINLRVQSHTGEKFFFCIKRDSKMQRLMDMYCDKQSMDRDGVVFLDDDRGTIIRTDKTADEIGIKEGDTILALLQQYGS